MRCHRDPAALATYISSGVRASELLGMACGDVGFGRPTITVVGKGSRERQTVPISPDAVVWIRLSRSSRVTGRAGRNRVLSATA
ncbi:tyrosine-type recombinase/integrase [Streptomyces sp. GbtcB7]|uniref:tyrosine-type recombinase/integrase n=1 Tax=Streptomyces sp. GbtcB7 TaxID=2824752 RepID=UPI001C2F99C2|nr:tyrosine-type recombinase/integrase [Streptomyces sp. GbtcB7]